jgi:hypothetical protein
MAGMLHTREVKNVCRNLVGKPTVGIPRRRHGKGKTFTLEQATKAQRRSRGIALLFH